MLRTLLIAFAACSAFLLFSANAAQAECKWVGTAPFCSGKCAGGWYQMKRQRSNYVSPGEPSFGKICHTGAKALCCRACPSGLVWREKFYLDVTCVTPAERTKARGY